MDKARKISTYLIIAIAFGFSIYFFVSPFLGSQDQSLMPGLNQSPDSTPTLTNDVDTCITNPSSDCDQEMLQIIKFCKDNKDQQIPVCLDARVAQYVDQRGLQRPVINTGR